MTVIALVAFATETLSMYQGQIATIDNTLAQEFIACGYVKEYSSGGGGGGDSNEFVVNINTSMMTADKTYEETFAAFQSGKQIRFNTDIGTMYPLIMDFTTNVFEYTTYNFIEITDPKAYVQLMQIKIQFGSDGLAIIPSRFNLSLEPES